jgi:hypothetical protein
MLTQNLHQAFESKNEQNNTNNMPQNQIRRAKLCKERIYCHLFEQSHTLEPGVGG